MHLLKGKKALIIGVANDKSIAYGIAKKQEVLSINHVNEMIERELFP
jgi:enoyl-[acyl-carrier protein] reductase I